MHGTQADERRCISLSPSRLSSAFARSSNSGLTSRLLTRKTVRRSSLHLLPSYSSHLPSGTCLHFAVSAQGTDPVRMLELLLTADPPPPINAPDIAGRTALHLAAALGFVNHICLCYLRL